MTVADFLRLDHAGNRFFVDSSADFSDEVICGIIFGVSTSELAKKLFTVKNLNDDDKEIFYEE